MIDITLQPTQLVLGQISSFSIKLTNSSNKPCTHVNFRLRLPPQIVLLEGIDKIDNAKIDPGQNIIHMMRVRPKQVGSWIISSSSFSYRDSQGQSQHPPPIQQKVKVIPVTAASESPEPKVLVKLTTEALPLKEWDQLEGEVINSGHVVLYNVSFRIVGPVASDVYNSQHSLGILHPSESKHFQVLVRAEESGNMVPLHIEVAYSDETGPSKLHDQLIPIQVTERHELINSQSPSEIYQERAVKVEKKSLTAPKIFISYSHVDEKYMTRLVSMLRPLEKQGILEIWHDREITAGNEWYQEIRNAINTCDLALLLVSVDFLNSRFIQEDELPRLLRLRKEKGLRVIPIIVRHCTWTSVPILKDLQALPKDGRPVISFKGAGQPDRIWTEIVQRIEELVKTL